MLSSIPSILLLMMMTVSMSVTKEITERRVIDLVFDKAVANVVDKNTMVLGFSTDFAVQQSNIAFDGSCKSVIGLLKTRKKGDFLLIVTNKMKLTCENEICKQNFGIQLVPTTNRQSSISYRFGCNHNGNTTFPVATGVADLVQRVMKRQRLFTPSKIPDEYVGLQANEGRLQKALMTLMGLVIAALIGVLVMKSMNQTKEKKKANEKEQARKAGKTAPAAAATKSSVKTPPKDDGSMKSKKEDPTGKTAAPNSVKSVKADESVKSAKTQVTKTAAGEDEKSNKSTAAANPDESAKSAKVAQLI